MRTLQRDLSAPGAILLISCYEMGHQPMGVALPMAVLRDAGYAVGALDLSVEELDAARVEAAAFVGISVPMHTALRLGAMAAERVRELNPTCHICIYGLYASLNENYLLERCADSCIGGNFEQSVLALVQSLEDGKEQVSGVSRPGSSSKPLLKKLSHLLPFRDTLPALDRYTKLDHNGRVALTGYVEGSRGCLHHCLHCPIPAVYGGRFFVYSQSTVLEDIGRQVEAGAEHITFGDPDFLNGPVHSLRIVEEMHREFPHLTFDCTIKVEHILEAPGLFSRLKEAGCLFVVSAVESLSERVLTILRKGHTRADVIRALAVLRNAGIAMRPTWVSFTPWTTLDDYLDVFHFIESQELIDHVDPVQYSIRLLVPPGSLLLDSPEMQPHLGPLAQDLFCYTWTHPDRHMDRLQQEVSKLVERSAAAGEDGAETFYRIWELAESVRHPEFSFLRQSLPLKRKRAPRLTEPWFC